jgi:hypothetical protein
MPCGVRAGQGKVPAAGLASSKVRSKSRSRRFPATLPQLPVMSAARENFRMPLTGHALPDLPPHRRLPAREPQRGPDRALPPGHPEALGLPSR